ncbi:hypothetical protein [Dactylosporangium sp. NPDC048998]|uniref:hypothetical protein n=1 Tax=Dactylosporangium sp. NPDC048998 TaxID=3363976 RepID=UPI003713D7BA
MTKRLRAMVLAGALALATAGGLAATSAPAVAAPAGCVDSTWIPQQSYFVLQSRVNGMVLHLQRTPRNRVDVWVNRVYAGSAGIPGTVVTNQITTLWVLKTINGSVVQRAIVRVCGTSWNRIVFS